MSNPPTCQWIDPDTQKVCGRDAPMPTMREDSSFGPYLCSEHMKRVNDDRDEVRRLVTEKGWEVADVDLAGLQLTRPNIAGSLSWDAVGGVGVRKFIDALR